MEQNKISFKELLKFGEEGEKDVALYLIKQGCSILPLYQFENNSAPKIIDEFEYISPDLTVFKNGKCFFVEVKTKQKWVSYKGKFETGCDFWHYKHYKSLAEKTGIELFMFFRHVNIEPVGYFIVNILEKGRHWDGSVNGVQIYSEMYFWEFEKLFRLTNYVE